MEKECFYGRKVHTKSQRRRTAHRAMVRSLASSRKNRKAKRNRLSKRPICRTRIRLGAKRMSNPRKSLATPLVPRQLSVNPSPHLSPRNRHGSCAFNPQSSPQYEVRPSTCTSTLPVNHYYQTNRSKITSISFPPSSPIAIFVSLFCFCFCHWSPPQSNFKPLTPLLVPARPLPNLDPPARTRSFRFCW